MTPRELRTKITAELSKAEIEYAEYEASSLLEHFLKLKRADFSANSQKEITKEDEEKLLSLAHRRVSGEPLQYIMGFWEFYSRKFFVGEGVLIPRDDTEVVLRSTFEHLDSIAKEREVKILDLCSGSGILAITLKCEYAGARVTAVEISETAAEYLRKNAEENNADIEIIQDDLFLCADKFTDGEFDLIISNPPYIKSSALPSLQKEVQFEPSLALDGGEDGCDFYRGIVSLFTKKLRVGGMLAFELDSAQGEIVKELMECSGFEKVEIFDDFSLIHRAVNGIKKA